MPPGTRVNVTFLANEDLDTRVAAARTCESSGSCQHRDENGPGDGDVSKPAEARRSERRGEDEERDVGCRDPARVAHMPSPNRSYSP